MKKPVHVTVQRAIVGQVVKVSAIAIFLDFMVIIAIYKGHYVLIQYMAYTCQYPF